jgi:hypothetical protein
MAMRCRRELVASETSWRCDRPKLAAVFALFLCAVTPPAFGEEIPDYDIEAVCERRAGGNTPDNRRYGSCLLLEEYALGELEDYWPRATEAVRVECLEETGGRESYVELASCVMFRVRQQRRHRE